MLKTLKQVEHILFAIIVIYIVTLPFASQIFAEFEVLAMSSVILLSCSFAFSVFRMGRQLSVTIIDVIVLLLLIYEWIHISVIAKYQIDGLFYLEGVVLGAIYLIARLVDKRYRTLLFFIIALSGGIQSLVGILQYSGILVGGNPDFAVTGSFNNPGPFGGYLSIAFIATVCLLPKEKNRTWKIAYCFWAGLIGGILIYSDSRAAWTAVLITLLYVVCKIGITSVLSVWKRRISCLLLICLCTGVMTGLYHYKQTSADVRLFIWTVSGSMMSDALLCGHGINSFSAKYMEYQARYLELHPDSEYVALADNNTQSFNELITIVCERGVCGLLIIVLLLFFAFISKAQDATRYLLLALCVFSCFSYPKDVLSLNFYFPLLLGLASRDSTPLLRVRKTAVMFAYAALLIPVIFFSIHTREYYKSAFDQLEKKNPQIILSHNGEYMARYASFLFERNRYETFIRWTTDSHFPFMTSVLKCDMGRAYMELGQMKEAEEALQCAYWMAPLKVLPKYLLFILYRDMQQNDKARIIAKEILSQKVAQIGSVYLEARTVAKAFLSKEVSEK